MSVWAAPMAPETLDLPMKTWGERRMRIQAQTVSGRELISSFQFLFFPRAVKAIPCRAVVADSAPKVPEKHGPCLAHTASGNRNHASNQRNAVLALLSTPSRCRSSFSFTSST